MRLSLTTWNINSVRLRIELVAKFLKAAKPDILCLQETKCPDDAFPLKRFNDDAREVAAGYECGIVLQHNQDIAEGDVLEVFETKLVKRQLQTA